MALSNTISTDIAEETATRIHYQQINVDGLNVFLP
jgi:hypothetical protein